MVSIFLPGATQIWLSSLFMPNVQTTLLVFGLGQSGREYWWQGFSSSVSPHSLPPFLAGVSTLRVLVFLPTLLLWCWRQQLDHSDHSDITQSTARAFKMKMADCVEQADKAMRSRTNHQFDSHCSHGPPTSGCLLPDHNVFPPWQRIRSIWLFPILQFSNCSFVTSSTLW